MRIFFLFLASVTLANIIHASDPTKRLPPPTPPYHSPHFAKKEPSFALRATADVLSLPAETFSLDATKIGIRTNSGEEQNLQTYLHHSLHQIHEDIAVIHEELQNVQVPAALPVAPAPIEHNAPATPLNQLLAEQEQRMATALQKQADALQNLSDTTSAELAKAANEVASIKDSHHALMTELREEKDETMQHKTWFRWTADHYTAASLVTLGLYHSQTLTNLLTKIPPLVTPVISHALPYAAIPTGLLFLGLFVADIHHNFQDVPYELLRSSWHIYFQERKWQRPKPSSFFMVPVAITKAISDNLCNVLKPACTMLISTGAVHLLLAAIANAHRVI